MENARAWLFEVARNALVDRLRPTREQAPLPDDLPLKEEEPAAVDSLAACLPRVLAELGEDDREALTLCDLEGLNQADYGAAVKGSRMSTAKSRVQRARRRLREHLNRTCQVRFDEADRVCCYVPRKT